MKVTINTGDLPALDWHAKDEQRVIQNVVSLLSVVRYEMPYNRTLGIPSDLADRPSTRLTQEYQAVLVELIEDNEPRAAVERLQYLGTDDKGQILFEVVMDIVS